MSTVDDLKSTDFKYLSTRGPRLAVGEKIDPKALLLVVASGLLLLRSGARKIFGLACEKTCRNDDDVGGRI